MIEIKNLTHDYFGHRALDKVNLTFKKNEITALVGPNGAGKTTLLKCLCGLMKPTEGEIFIEDINVYEKPREAHTKVGYLPDFFGLYDSLTVRQHLQYAAESHNMETSLIEEAIVRTAQQINLEDKLEEKAAALSRGMKQRLAIGQVVIFKPDYLVLDEPASGLDPEARVSLSKLFIQLKNEGMSLIVSSHILAELEEYATELVVIRDGKLYKTESDIDETKVTDTSNIWIEVETLLPNSAVLPVIKEYNPAMKCVEQSNGLRIFFSQDKDEQVKFLEFLTTKKCMPYRFNPLQRKMQDRYFESIGDTQ
ncbi:MAG: ABC transporter ATP-binding protein [Chitinophagales bacterium]